MARKKFWLGKHLMMKGKYADIILSGKKTTTIRPGKVEVKAKEFLIHAGGKIIARAVLEDVRYKRLKNLTDEDARLDGFSSKEELKKELKEFYPDMKEHDWVTIIRFRIVEKLDRPEEKSYAGKSAYEIAEIALRNADALNLTDEEKNILKKLTETKSLRATARELYGNINERRRVRKILWRRDMGRYKEGEHRDAEMVNRGEYGV